MCTLRNNFVPSLETVYLQNTKDPTAEVENLFEVAYPNCV